MSKSRDKDDFVIDFPSSFLLRQILGYRLCKFVGHKYVYVYIYIYINSAELHCCILCIHMHKGDLIIALHYALATFSVTVMADECAMLSIKIINIYLFK